jgi:hypothetical protein
MNILGLISLLSLLSIHASGCSDGAARKLEQSPDSAGDGDGDGDDADDESDERYMSDGDEDDRDPDGDEDTPAGEADAALEPALDAGDSPQPGGGDYRQRGELTVASSVETVQVTGCTLDVGTFTPARALADVAVLLTPGFAIGPGLGSSREALDALAEHIASWGLVTHTVSLCTNGGSIDHARNGAVLAAFGAGLGRATLYGGFSAGGLAAMLAAAQAPEARGLLALDAVDTEDLARGALEALEVPVHALAGEPSGCNSDGNMLAQYRGRSVRVLKVNEAHHFIFEGAACEGLKCALCSGGGEPEAEAVRALATAFVLGASGAVPSALDWWRAGSAELAELTASGLVAEVQ